MATGFMVVLLVGACVGAGETLGAATMMTLTGTVSDAKCGAKHADADAVTCTKDCVKGGSDYALIVGGKAYTLKADKAAKAELDKLAGHQAEVSGDVDGMTVMVKSVKMGMMKK